MTFLKHFFLYFLYETNNFSCWHQKLYAAKKLI